MTSIATNVKRNDKKTTRNKVISTPQRRENYMILSTTYPLNNSDTKRIQVGLCAVNEDATFVPTIKLSGTSSGGLYFERETWEKFQENVERTGEYLREISHDIPDPIYINDIVLNFTTAYGARAITLSYRSQAEQKMSENAAAGTAGDSETPPTKKRRTYAPSIVMQKISFEGLENIIKCVNERYSQLNSLVNLVNDCVRFLVTEIELNLPNRYPDEDIVKQTLAENYQEIRHSVLRQLKDLNFLDAHFEILFEELTALHLHEIVRVVIAHKTSLIFE